MTTGFEFCATCGTPRGSDIRSSAPGAARHSHLRLRLATGAAALRSRLRPPSRRRPSPACLADAARPSYPPAYRLVRHPPTWGSARGRTATGGAAKMLGKVLMVLIVLVVATAGVVSWLGVAQVPVLSAAFGIDHPRDLHMVRDPAALKRLHQ